MKQVTISNEALEAIHIAGKEAAYLARINTTRDKGHDKIFDTDITLSNVKSALAFAEPLDGWTLAVHEDAVAHAEAAYRKHILRHNVQVYTKMGDGDRFLAWQLAREKRTRRRNRRDYSEKLYHNARAEARRKANAELEHKRMVEAVTAEVRRKALTEARYAGEDYIGIDNPTGIVDDAIWKYGHWGEITAFEYTDFLDTLEREFMRRPLDEKTAPAYLS